MTAHRPQHPPLLVPALATFAISAILGYVAMTLGATGLALTATVVAGLALTTLLVGATAQDRRDRTPRRGRVPY